MNTIRLVGLNRRGVNRINEHGNTFIFKHAGFFEGRPAILVESLNGPWSGWFTENEVEILSE